MKGQLLINGLSVLWAGTQGPADHIFLLWMHKILAVQNSFKYQYESELEGRSLEYQICNSEYLQSQSPITAYE